MTTDRQNRADEKSLIRKLDFIIPRDGDNKAKLMPFPQIMGQLKKFNLVTPDHLQGKENKIMVYDNGIYTNKGAEKQIYSMLQSGLGDMITPSHIRNTLMMLAKETLFDITDFDEDKDILNCGNGLLNVKTLDFKSHNPSYKSVIQIPTNYNSNATCPAIDKFLGEVVGEEYKDTMYEIAGFCLLNDMPIEKMILLIGSGSNGKSVYLQVLERMLGNNTDSKALEKLDKDPYAVAYLKDKLVNIGGDISGKSIENSATFKALTSKEKIDAQVKYGSNIQFSPTCKLIFSANNPPGTKDYSDGFWRRWVLVKFPNKFPPNAGLLNTLTTEKELEGFLVKALEGLHRLLENNCFTNSLGISETIEMYDNERNSFYDWFEDRVEKYGTESVSITEFYSDYTLYCKEMGVVTIESEQGFGKKLGFCIKDDIAISKKRKSVEGKKVMFYTGIELAD